MIAKIKKAKPTEQEQVNEWMSKLDPEIKPAINAVRKIIKSAGPKLNERIKWNAPSYYYKEDIVTFGPARSKDRIILVFHHPNIVKIKSALLEGDYKNRRLVYFNSLSKIKAGKTELERIIAESIRMMDKMNFVW
jgi:uncharacterized protein YdhG (YjbR/CyaY superfamily)